MSQSDLNPRWIQGGCHIDECRGEWLCQWPRFQGNGSIRIRMRKSPGGFIAQEDGCQRFRMSDFASFLPFFGPRSLGLIANRLSRPLGRAGKWL